MAKSMSFETIRTIMRMGDRQMEPNVIRDITNEDINKVTAVLIMHRYMKAGNWRLILEQFAKKDIREEWITVCSEEMQVIIPGMVRAQIRDIAAGKPWPDKTAEEKPDGETPAEAPASVVPVEDHWKEEKLLLGQIVAALTAQNELLTQLIDTVLPRYVGDLKDNVNVNADLLAQRAKGCEDKLESIKLGMRKRGM